MARTVRAFAALAAIFAVVTAVPPADAFEGEGAQSLNHQLTGDESVGAWDEVSPGVIVYEVSRRLGLWRTDFAGNAVQLSDFNGATHFTTDGAYGVFVADPENDGIWDLYSVAVDGSGVVLLESAVATTGEILSDRGAFALAPDSAAVIFQKRSAGGDWALWRVPVGGGTVTRLSKTGATYGDVGTRFVLTPNGSHLVYSIKLEGGGGQTQRVSPLGGVSSKLSNELSFLDVSPDSRYLIYRTASRLKARDIDSGTLANLSGPIPDHTISNVGFSPDGAFLVYRMKGPRGPYHLHVASFSGGDAIQITPRLADDVSTGFGVAPGGTSVMFVAETPNRLGNELYVVDPDGTNLARIVDSEVRGDDVTNHAFSPDGTRAIYSYAAFNGLGTYARLYSKPIDGGDAVELTGPLIAKNGVAFTIASNDRIIFIGYADPIKGTGHEARRKVYVTSIESGGATLISRPTVGHAGAAFGVAAADGQHVIYSGEAFQNDRRELFLGPLTPPLCDGKVPTIAGSHFDDTIEGTTAADVIVGLGGNDIINGRAGNDTICGGLGADDIAGGFGPDRLFGQAGPDQLSGDNGADWIEGGAGADIIRGGDKKDRLFGGAKADTIRGGSGNDILKGGPGQDQLMGEDDDDFLWGEAGPDSLDGGSGDDVCRGGAGSDQAYTCETLIGVP